MTPFQLDDPNAQLRIQFAFDENALPMTEQREQAFVALEDAR